MSDHKISIISPSIRPEMIKIVAKCIRRQDFTDWEWIITTHENKAEEMERNLVNMAEHKLLIDPPKEKGDFWSLCKGWNKAYAHSKGDLIVNIQDGIWFPPDVLSKFMFHYKNNPRALVTAVGHQYTDIDSNGMPINLFWFDPRCRADKTFVEVLPMEVEMVMCSIPKQALWECGGLDEEYDTCNAAQEKEMCQRLNKLGWDFYMDQSIEYRAIHHPRLTKDWDKIYKEKTTPLFVRHMTELDNGTRTLNVNNLLKYIEH